MIFDAEAMFLNERENYLRGGSRNSFQSGILGEWIGGNICCLKGRGVRQDCISESSDTWSLNDQRENKEGLWRRQLGTKVKVDWHVEGFGACRCTVHFYRDEFR